MSTSTRQLADWVNAFTAHRVRKGNPRIFARWTAVSIIAGAMERKVYMPTQEGNLYANHYIMLVGTPAMGKTRQVVPARELWQAEGRINVGPSSTTGAALIDKLRDAKTEHEIEGRSVTGHALSFASAEWATFMHQYDTDIKGRLTELYDGGKFHESIRKRKEDVLLENLFLNMLIATQPAALARQLTPEEWDTGLSSRFIMVYSPDKPKPANPHAIKPTTDETELKALIHDLRLIYDTRGQLRKAQPYMDADWNWIQAEHEPAPTHHKLTSGYNARRWVHLAKLTMVLAVSRGSDIITLRDWQRAKAMLQQAERNMPAMFTAIMSKGGLTAIVQDAEEILRKHMVAGKPYDERKVHRLLSALGNTRNMRSVTDLIGHIRNAGVIRIAGSASKKTVILCNERAPQ